MQFLVMCELVEGSQCAAYVTEFGSQFVNIALLVVQGVSSVLCRSLVACF